MNHVLSVVNQTDAHGNLLFDGAYADGGNKDVKRLGTLTKKETTDWLEGNHSEALINAAAHHSPNPVRKNPDGAAAPVRA